LSECEQHYFVDDFGAHPISVRSYKCITCGTPAKGLPVEIKVENAMLGKAWRPLLKEMQEQE